MCHCFIICIHLFLQKTRAYRKLTDDVPDDVKKRRALEVGELFRTHALQRHKKEIGKYHLVQVLGVILFLLNNTCKNNQFIKKNV